MAATDEGLGTLTPTVRARAFMEVPMVARGKVKLPLEMAASWLGLTTCRIRLTPFLHEHPARSRLPALQSFG